MSKPFDMELFLTGVLTGSHTTRERHLRQAKAIQAAISERWHRENPWTWQQKHLIWFVNHHLNQHSGSTRYYYLLTAQLLTLRLGKSWRLIALGEDQHPSFGHRLTIPPEKCPTETPHS